MKYISVFVAAVIVFCMCSVPVFADNSVSDELHDILQGLPDISQAFTPPAAEDDGAQALDPAPEVEDDLISDSPIFDYPAATIDSTYGGAWNGSVLDYFAGVMRGHPFKDYVCYRASQYVYYLYFGTDISVENGYFRGSDLTLITYTTNQYNGSNEYISVSSGQSLNISTDGIFYSNVLDTSAHLEGVHEIEIILVASIMCGCLLTVQLFRSFFRS